MLHVKKRLVFNCLYLTHYRFSKPKVVSLSRYCEFNSTISTIQNNISISLHTHCYCNHSKKNARVMKYLYIECSSSSDPFYFMFQNIIVLNHILAVNLHVVDSVVISTAKHACFPYNWARS
jgi:hypothetical protein